MKRAIIVGASSGIGYRVAARLINRGWQVGVAARRTERLETLRALAPERVSTTQIDVTHADATQALQQLIERLGGMDLYFHAAGIGKQNHELVEEIELKTAETNATGFMRMVGHAFRYMAANGGGHIAVISSIAGTKGLGAAPAYSATKALQNTYIEALSQLANAKKLNIRFTDLRPGFVDTDLLRDGNKYPLLLKPDAVADDIVRAIDRRRAVVVIDWRWRIITWAWRHLIPHSLWRHLSPGVVISPAPKKTPNS